YRQTGGGTARSRPGGVKNFPPNASPTESPSRERRARSRRSSGDGSSGMVVMFLEPSPDPRQQGPGRPHQPASRSELEDDLALLVQTDPDLLVIVGVEGHDRLADRPLDPEAPVTPRDGDFDSSPLPAGFLD